MTEKGAVQTPEGEDKTPEDGDYCGHVHGKTRANESQNARRYSHAHELGEIEPAGSRQLGRRSAVLVADETVVVGTASGAVIAFDDQLEKQWRSRSASGDDASLVSMAVVDDCVVVGERGPSGGICCYELADGTCRWRYETAVDIGTPQKETRFFLPFVADIVADDEYCYAAARRYERVNGARTFQSVVYAFRSDGTVAWRYEADASPISLAVRDGDGDADERLAVAYNRCPGTHQCGLVGLDSRTGEMRLTWDPGTAGQRRVGDVAFLGSGLVVASHGDYCGYLLDERGGERWRLGLATPERIDGHTVYAYPNHVHATEAGVTFVTGNTYPENGRETDVRHPDEHTIVGCTPDGERMWSESADGFATGIGTRGRRISIPAAQHFRDRTASTHGYQVLDLADGSTRAVDTDGVVTATALGDELVAAIEEPVQYHDEPNVRGTYRLHARRFD